MVNAEYAFDWKEYDKAIRKYCLENDLHYTKFLRERGFHPESMVYQKNNKKSISDQILKKVANIKEVNYKKFMGKLIDKYETIDLPEDAIEYMSKAMVSYYKNKKKGKIRLDVRNRYLETKK